MIEINAFKLFQLVILIPIRISQNNSTLPTAATVALLSFLLKLLVISPINQQKEFK